MKKKIFLLITICLLLTACSKEKKQKESIKPTKSVDPIELELESMSIEQKIAQMLIIDYTKDNVDSYLQKILKTTPPGGFIITQDNITTYEKTKKYIQDIKDNSKITPIISIDQEGGNVQRLQGITDVNVLDVPYMYDVGKTKDENKSYKVGEVLAHEMKTIGINVVYAPVLDIYLDKNNTVIGKRSFGESKELVSKMAISTAKGIEDNGIIPTFKHFPGHGDTAIDSHFSLPVLNKTKEELEKQEFYPFKEAIKNNAKIIMVGHLSVPSIDKTYPATMSNKIINILKDELNYNGLIITDALNMGALTNDYSDEEIYKNTINAGADLLLMPGEFEETIKLIKKNIPEERINESVMKILKFKKEYLKDYKLLDKSYLNNKDDKEIINSIN